MNQLTRRLQPTLRAAEATMALLMDSELLAGSLPQRQQRLVEAWAELHQDELQSDWQLLLAGRRPAPIQPLS